MANKLAPNIFHYIFNGPGIVRAVLKHLCNWLRDWLIDPFTLNLQNTVTLKPYDLKFWENIYSLHVWHVTGSMSCVMCHMSHITCKKWILIYLFFLFFFWKSEGAITAGEEEVDSKTCTCGEQFFTVGVFDVCPFLFMMLLHSMLLPCVYSLASGSIVMLSCASIGELKDSRGCHNPHVNIPLWETG